MLRWWMSTNMATVLMNSLKGYLNMYAFLPANTHFSNKA